MMKYKFLVILMANEILEEHIQIEDVPKKLRPSVIQYLKEKFGVDITQKEEN